MRKILLALFILTLVVPVSAQRARITAGNGLKETRDSNLVFCIDSVNWPRASASPVYHTFNSYFVPAAADTSRLVFFGSGSGAFATDASGTGVIVPQVRMWHTTTKCIIQTMQVTNSFDSADIHMWRDTTVSDASDNDTIAANSTIWVLYRGAAAGSTGMQYVQIYRRGQHVSSPVAGSVGLAVNVPFIMDVIPYHMGVRQKHKVIVTMTFKEVQ